MSVFNCIAIAQIAFFSVLTVQADVFPKILVLLLENYSEYTSSLKIFK